MWFSKLIKHILHPHTSSGTLGALSLKPLLLFLCCVTLQMSVSSIYTPQHGCCSLQSARKTTILPVLLMFITVLRSIAVLYCSEFNLDFQKFSWWKLEQLKASCTKYFFSQSQVALFIHFVHKAAWTILFNLIFLYHLLYHQLSTQTFSNPPIHLLYLSISFFSLFNLDFFP